MVGYVYAVSLCQACPDGIHIMHTVLDNSSPFKFFHFPLLYEPLPFITCIVWLTQEYFCVERFCCSAHSRIIL